VLLDFFPQASPAQLARKRNVCSGAKARPHSHFFTKDGQFGSVDDNNQQVDDASYRVVSADEVRIGHGLFHYRIDGVQLVLEPMISAAARRAALAHPTKFNDAGWQVAVSYMGLPWKRVSCDGWC
jgi:hypothetical protein